MFTVQDFIDLLNYLKTGTTDTALDPNTMVLAKAERATTTSLFSDKLDASVFMSEDYKRLRLFLMDWYAAHKTMVSTQKRAHDVFSLPKSHLNELMASFGFDIELDNISVVNEANFFLDLVNLYKIKGSPKSLIQLLGYYGMSRMDLLEYWLQYDESGNLIFRPNIVISSETELEAAQSSDIPYESMVKDDPHWFITREQIEALFNNKQISFPIKSPYFGIRPLYYLTDIMAITAIVVRKCIDEYNQITYGVITELPKEVNISKLNYRVSLLELYLTCDYLLNTCYGYDTGITGQLFTCYDGTNSDYLTIVDEYNSYITRPSSRAERDQKLTEFTNLFSKPRSEAIITTFTKSGEILTALSPTLKSTIDVWVDAGRGEDLLAGCLKDLSDWVSENISTFYSNFSSFILGIESLEFLTNIINFFKPYRAREFLNDSGLIIKNPLADYMLVEDTDPDIIIDSTFIDWDTPNSVPGLLEEATEDIPDNRHYYSRTRLDQGSYFDIGTAMDPIENPVLTYINDTILDVLNSHPSDSTSQVHVDYTLDSTGDVQIVLTTGGFVDFDSDGCFDSPYVSDACQIYVLPSS